MTLHPVPIDLETTGLHIADDLILEFGMLVVDSDLKIVAEFGSRVIHHEESALDARMSDYVRDMHTASGLLDEVAESSVTLAEVDEEARQFLRDLGFTESEHAHERDLILMGSSCRLDLGMIELQMPALQKMLHYRMIDCSGLRETLKMFTPELMTRSTYRPNKLEGLTQHRAYADALRTLEEAREQRSALAALTSAQALVPAPGYLATELT